MLTALAFALALACAHPAPPVLIAPDGTEYVQDCPDGLEDVECFEYVTR